MTREIGMSASNAVGVVQRASKWFARSRKSGFVRSQFDVLRSRSKLMASAYVAAAASPSAGLPAVLCTHHAALLRVPLTAAACRRSPTRLDVLWTS